MDRQFCCLKGTSVEAQDVMYGQTVVLCLKGTSVEAQDVMYGQTVVLCLKGRDWKIVAPYGPTFLLLAVSCKCKQL